MYRQVCVTTSARQYSTDEQLRLALLLLTLLFVWDDTLLADKSWICN